MKNTLETRLGIFVALAVIAAVLILEMLGGIERFQRGYLLYGEFRNVQDLKVGDRVKIAGVEVGRVDDIRLTNQVVRVAMKLRKEVQVKTDSIAKIQFTGLMGQNFIAVDFGSPEAPVAMEGSYLKTAEQPDLAAVMQRMDNVAIGVENLTKSFTGEKIDNILGPFTDLIRATKEPLTDTIQNMRSISGQIASGQGTVGMLIYSNELHTAAYSSLTNIQVLTDELKLGLADARAAIADAREVVAQVNAGKGTVGKLLKDETLYNETTTSMTNLKEILQKMNRGEGTVGKILNDQDLYKNAKLTLQKLDKATEGLEDQGPLSVMGLVLGNLF